MKQFIAKIALFFLTIIFLNACNTTKRVPARKKLLVETQVNVNSKKNTDDEVNSQLYQKRNSSFLGLKIRLTLFNWAKPKSDSTFAVWLNKKPQRKRNLIRLLSQKQVGRLQKSFFVAGISNQLKKIGEPPVIFDSISTNKSVKRLNYYYFNKGFFDVKTTYTTDTSLTKKIKIKYATVLGTPFIIDSLKSTIDTPVLDSLYQVKKSLSLVKSNKQYKTSDFEAERSRISIDFRNNGAFYFQPNYISYDIDTVQTNKKINVKLLIKNFSYRESDSSKTKPFKLYKLSKVNIFPDHTNGKNQMQISDTVNFRKFTFLAEKKLKYKPKSITNAIFLIPGNTYSDIDDGLTRKYISNLRIFNFPSIIYTVDPLDDNKLIANIYLTALKKYSL
ncbi:MAG: outer membrane protein assembly factor, partial [Flavobacterium sp.]|nr:outer membrane protein assembly factor [Flavobacterium sp.]